MTTTKTTKQTTNQMAAVAAMFPRGTRDSKGRLLPLRYRVAAQMAAKK